MRRRESPHNGGTSQSAQRGIVPVELRLRLPVESDASFAGPAENEDHRSSSAISRFPVVRIFAGVSISLLLGWTIYYDLIAHHPPPVVTPGRSLPAAPVAAVTFPANGTVIADYKASEIAGPGMTFQTPSGDLGCLFVVVLEDWQTGMRVGLAYLRANTIETLRPPPGRYRIVVASVHVWQGDELLFGSETRVDETLRPVEVKADQATPDRLALAGDAIYPTTQVPTDLIVRLLSGHH